MIIWLGQDKGNKAKFFSKGNYLKLHKEKKDKYKNNEESILVKTDIMAKKFSNSNIKKH